MSDLFLRNAFAHGSAKPYWKSSANPLPVVPVSLSIFDGFFFFGERRSPSGGSSLMILIPDPVTELYEMSNTCIDLEKAIAFAISMPPMPRILL